MWGDSNFGYANVDASGRSGGVLSIWDTSLFYNTMAMGEEGYLAVVGSWKGKNGLVGFINIYGPQEVERKEILWKKISVIMESIDAAWCVFGDFNEVRSSDERLNSNVNLRGSNDFNEFIRRDELIDIPLGGRKFTRVSDDWLKFSKLDQFFVSNSFSDLWTELAVVALDRDLSDHCPIEMKNNIVDFGPKPFRIFDVWLEDKECDMT